MIDRERALIKIQEKLEYNRYGLSIVHLIPSSSKLSNKIDTLIKGLGEYEEWFDWIQTENRHISFLKCSSIRTDFEVSEESINYFNDIFNDKYTFALSTLSFHLDSDGVIRAYFSSFPSELSSQIDINLINTITSRRYRIDAAPSATIGFVKPNELNRIIDNYTEISALIENRHKTITHSVDSLYAVKYNNNSFYSKQIVQIFKLKNAIT